MAVLTGITGAVRANIAGAAQQAVRSAATGVKKIAGLPTEGGNSALGAASNLMGGTSSNILTYPIAVDTDPQQGHYILFHINTRKNGKLLTPKTKKNMKGSITSIENDLNIELDRRDSEGSRGGLGRQAIADGGAPITFVKKEAAADDIKQQSFTQSKIPTKRLEKTIALYMPPSVQVSYDVKYGDKEIGAAALAGQGVIDSFVDGGGSYESFLEGLAKTGKGPVKEAAIGAINKSIDAAATGTEALFQLARGSVITPRMEMMFEGVGRRNFSYTFAFIPKSKQEAVIVEDIIQHFKFYMMPAYSNPNTRREMDIPGTFDIEYMYRGNRNNFLNRISTCYLTSAKVQYGADRYTAYEETTGNRGRGSPPQKSSLTLEFTELEILSQEAIGKGF